jgi:hypothetical protein
MMEDYDDYPSESTRDPGNDAYWHGVGAEEAGIQADDNPFDLQTQEELYHQWHYGWLFGRQLTKMELEQRDEDEEIPW